MIKIVTSLRIYSIAFTFTLLAVGALSAEDTFYDLNTIQKIEIFFSKADWDYQLDTSRTGSDGYIMADRVIVNGVQFDSVGVKYKGNSSYNSQYIKNPFHISLDEFKSQSYEGIKSIKLANGFQDPSMIREALAYRIAKDYMNCPRANYAEVYVNGTLIGLYTNTEAINKQFCSDNFYSSGNTFVSCSPPKSPGPTTKSNLKYLENADSSAYYKYYELKSDCGWNEIIGLCDTVTNHPEYLGTVLDVDRALWMVAFDNVLVNLDSYMGVFSQNYYLYRDKTNRFNPIIWDLNMSFGGFPHPGSSNTSMGTLDINSLPGLSLAVHSQDRYWPLINAIQNNAAYKKMYIAHAKTIVEEWFGNQKYIEVAGLLQSIIDSAVSADPNKFYTYYQFKNGLTQNVTGGKNVVPGIGNLMASRISYLASTAEFQAVAPEILSVKVSDDNPQLNGIVTITAEVTGASAESVYLGIRFDKEDKFTLLHMYDDGAHNDGAADDNSWGTDITMESMEAHYYVYAENDSAGKFLPAGAEHSFYTINSSAPVAEPGQLVINEFMAKNTSGTVNESGSYEDWIEFYNTTADTLNMSGLYLSDDASNLSKFTFPGNTVIAPGSYLTVWADEGTSTQSSVHCNFKMAASGETLILSNSNGAILDSVTFGEQAADVSMGRCPNGTGSFITLEEPTFNGANLCQTEVEEATGPEFRILYPNPAQDYIMLPEEWQNAGEIGIYSNVGLEIYRGEARGTIDVRNFAPGAYFLRCSRQIFLFIKI